MVKPQIDIIYFNAGGGHKATATALEFKMQDTWDVSLINLRDVYNSVDFINCNIKVRIEDIYNNSIRYGYTWANKFLLKLLQLSIKYKHDELVQSARNFWSDRKPDIVVSVIPQFNKSLYEAINSLNIPYITIMTDMADTPPNFWLEHQDQYFIAGTEHSYSQAINYIPTNKLFRISGLPIHPYFDNRSKVHINRWNNTTSTALICFGGYGSNRILKLVKLLANTKLDLQLEIVSGNNTRLYNNLLNIDYHHKSRIHSFVNSIPKLMNQCDFLIGKPGPGIISEAVHSYLPILLDNHQVMIQEHYNLEWVKDHGIGTDADILNIKQLYDFISALNYMKSNTYNINNQGIHEIPAILKDLV